MAGNLALRGHDVALYEHPAFKAVIAAADTPVMDATLALCGLVLERDQHELGQNMEAMGLSDKSVREITGML